MSTAPPAATPALTAADLKVNHCYSAKRPQEAGLFDDRLNDRQILYINLLDRVVQYDSPTVRNGRQYPKTSIESFLKWAAADVTTQMPKGEWRRARQQQAVAA